MNKSFINSPLHSIKKNYPDISLKEVDNLYNNLEINQLLKKPVIKKSKFYKIVDVPLTFQIDIMIFNKSQKIKNRGIYMYLTLIDILSRKAFMYPIPTQEYRRNYLYHRYILYISFY